MGTGMSGLSLDSLVSLGKERNKSQISACKVTVNKLHPKKVVGRWSVDGW